MSNDYKAVQLHNRSKIEISGDDKIEFLQGLLTQDITLLNALPLLYACLLTPQGKFLHDMFLFQNDNSIIIDCEGLERANDLYKRFKKYKLRSKVTITEPSTLTVYQIWNGDFNESLQDPRHAACGYRLYSDSTGIKTVDYDEWDTIRIQNEIPDGSRDFIVEKSFIHEGRLDEFNAVSYTKGCYVGQELVSRIHHRGLAKKQLRCVNLDTVANGTDIRSTNGSIGLALLKINQDS